MKTLKVIVQSQIYFVQLGIFGLVIPFNLGFNQFYFFIGSFFFLNLMLSISMLKIQPGLFYRRSQVNVGEEPSDKILGSLFNIASLFAVMVASFENKLALTVWNIPWSIPIGLLIQVLAFVLFFAAVAANPHYETFIRHQEDVDHKVVKTGVYSWIRHPGYLGQILLAISYPLILESYLAFLFFLAACFVFRFRMNKEEAFLSEKLTGYAEYKQETKWKLIPRVY